MDMTSVSDARPNGDTQDLQPQPHGDWDESGHSGEGSASALAHLKSQARHHRHQTGDADDAAGTGGHAQ